MAPRVGFEPTTVRLTVGCSTAELPRNIREPNQSALDSMKCAEIRSPKEAKTRMCLNGAPLTATSLLQKPDTARKVPAKEAGGHGRNRTGVYGFAVRCVTTPPRGQSTCDRRWWRTAGPEGHRDWKSPDRGR